MAERQNYVSNELTHFVGRGLGESQQFNLLVKILNSGVLKKKEWPDNIISSQDMDMSKKISDNELYIVYMVCFCDIPISEMNIHMKKYSPFGISFKKKFIAGKGATPVHYIDKNSTMPRESWMDMFDNYSKKINKFFNDEYMRKGRKPEELKEIMNMRFFIDQYIMSYLKFFDSSKEDDDENNYYMEREWRSLIKVEFELDDIYRIILPVKYLSEFMSEFPNYKGHITTV
ncbi:abortive infection system antitoxin AbiGi family protein [Sporosalibacterium faouarense]|uniref:abortive infection system antitoxin AbiGi family protein n=1 Tax=Sporosalibacterium faouarense TaxID=516123 RepID=UPI00141CEB16|nr:abortive infection system antitoxin AbiGi family protein [Sporosalibacterium faouarense]MTI49903.1 hypothetical protein [Bacillota bacterium]